MADKKQMSVEEILAACRRLDGPGGGSEASSPAPAPAEPVTEADEPAVEAAASAETPADPPAPAPPAKPAGQMSVAEILAAARGEKSQSAAPAAKPAPPKAPAAAAGGEGKKPSEMSVAEMLAAARAGKGGGAAPAAKPAAAKAPAAAKPTAKAAPAAAKAKPTPAKAAGPKDTASILAAARKQAKPGPISKAEAAERNKVLEQQAAKAKPARQEKVKPEVPPMPAKPAYARPQPAAAGPARSAAAAPEEGRRNFLTILWATPLAIGFSTIAVTNLLWLLGLARFMFPNILTEPPTVFKVGFPDDYAPGQVEEKFKAQFGVWIVRYEYEGAPQIYALKSVCTHLGCTPNWLDGEQKFKCPCHGSGFYKDGINFEGPAPRPLERYAIRLADDGQIEVDKSRTFNQELGQWTNASSYVVV